MKLSSILLVSLFLSNGHSQAAERVFNSTGNNSFAITNLSGKVEINSQANSDIKVTYNHKKPAAFAKLCSLDFIEKNKKVFVKVQSKEKNPENPCETDFKIIVPMTDKLDLKMGSGDLFVKGDYAKVEAELGSGNVKFEANALKLEIDMGAGDLSGLGKIAEKFELKMGTGNVQFSFLEAQRVSVRGGQGAVHFVFERPSEKSNVSIHLGVGSASITYKKVPDVGTLSVNNGLGSTEVFLPKTTLAEFDLSAGMGSKTNEFTPSTTSRFKIKAFNGLGDLAIRKLK